VASAGEAVRLWAAGHLEKGREVTRSGPYRWTGHPLYVGSSVIALGIVIAANDVVVAIVAAVYMGATITAAIRSEERFLRGAFPSAYDKYRRTEGGASERAFCWSRVMRNREYRAVTGLLAGFAFLALKVALQI
jgi:hypothetical protein